MAIPDTLLIEGEDIEDYACIEWPADYPHTQADMRGELPMFPGVDGAVNVDQPFGPQVLSIPVGLASVGCSQEEEMEAANQKYRNLRRLSRPGQVVTLTRVMSYPGGLESHEALAKLLTMTPSRLALQVMKAVLDFTLLELWYGPAVSTGALTTEDPGTTVDVEGDVRTHRMEITLPAGAARTVYNNTNGHWVTFNAVAAAGGVLIDVEARTATNITGGADVSRYLLWGKAYPMRLDPGENVFSVTDGTSASISYQPAYL